MRGEITGRDGSAPAEAREKNPTLNARNPLKNLDPDERIQGNPSNSKPQDQADPCGKSKESEKSKKNQGGQIGMTKSSNKCRMRQWGFQITY
jgi:hypothetical protein